MTNAPTAHPSPAELALFSKADLPFAHRIRIRRHLSRCGECEHQVHLFRSADHELKREASTETLTAFEAIADWGRLEREMMGNIAVGLAAAHCIENVGRKRRFFYRAAFAGGLILLFGLAWMTHIPRQETSRLVSTVASVFMPAPRQPFGPVLRTSPDGITVRTQGAALTILHPPSAVISLSGGSSVSARYVDDDTGQVTITKVYAQ